MMGAVLASLFLALKSTDDYLNDAPSKSSQSPKQARVWQDLTTLWQRPYVRAIAIMVFALAFMNTMLEFKSQKIIDHKQAEVAYLKHFSSLNTELCRQHNCERQIHTEALNEVLNLRTVQKEQRASHLLTWSKAHHLKNTQADLDRAYVAFQTELESLTRAYLSEINFWTNLLGVILLLVFARPLFHYLGIRQVLVQLPACFLVIGVMLFFPLELSVMGLVLIGSGTLNYSLNKTAKELLYTQADDTTRFRFKPLIDGPVMRFGDVSAAALSILCLDALHLPEHLADNVLIIVGMGLSLWWFASSWRVGKEYETLKSKQSDEALLSVD
jgi:ATP/ADP translocase